MRASYRAWTIGQTSVTRGRFASLPGGQQKTRVSDDGLSVTIWDESGTKHMTLGFAAEAGSIKLRKQWVACIASANGPQRFSHR